MYFLLSQANTVVRQQARIERLKIELTTEKARLVSMQNEITSLENTRGLDIKVLKEQLQKEIKQLRGQCERLVFKIDQKLESRGSFVFLFKQVCFVQLIRIYLTIPEFN